MGRPIASVLELEWALAGSLGSEVWVGVEQHDVTDVLQDSRSCSVLGKVLPR